MPPIESYYNRPNLLIRARVKNILIAEKMVGYLLRINPGLLEDSKIFIPYHNFDQPGRLLLGCPIQEGGDFCKVCPTEGLPTHNDLLCLTDFCKKRITVNTDSTVLTALLLNLTAFLDMLRKIAGTEDLYIFSGLPESAKIACAQNKIEELVQRSSYANPV